MTDNSAPNSAPGFKKNPTHSVTLTPYNGRVQVLIAGAVVADTQSAVTVSETNHGDCFYIPRNDVVMSQAEPTDTTSYCPYKGEASYYSFGTAKDAAWSYEAPYDECAGLANYLSFYPNRVDEIQAS